jgi:hypothetical protein
MIKCTNGGERVGIEGRGYNEWEREGGRGVDVRERERGGDIGMEGARKRVRERLSITFTFFYV